MCLYKGPAQSLICGESIARISIDVAPLKDLGEDLLRPFSSDVCIAPATTIQEVPLIERIDLDKLHDSSAGTRRQSKRRFSFYGDSRICDFLAFAVC